MCFGGVYNWWLCRLYSLVRLVFVYICFNYFSFIHRNKIWLSSKRNYCIDDDTDTKPTISSSPEYSFQIKKINVQTPQHRSGLRCHCWRILTCRAVLAEWDGGVGEGRIRQIVVVKRENEWRRISQSAVSMRSEFWFGRILTYWAVLAEWDGGGGEGRASDSYRETWKTDWPTTIQSCGFLERDS